MLVNIYICSSPYILWISPSPPLLYRTSTVGALGLLPGNPPVTSTSLTDKRQYWKQDTNYETPHWSNLQKFISNRIYTKRQRKWEHPRPFVTIRLEVSPFWKNSRKIVVFSNLQKVHFEHINFSQLLFWRSLSREFLLSLICFTFSSWFQIS